MTLHDLIILMTLPVRGTKHPRLVTMKYNVKYTSQYIPKLQIHQHSLLTRNIFSWHNSSVQVFVTRSSSKMDHHQIWIITRSSSKLDHRQSWIIIVTAVAISSKWCYLSNLLVIGSSTVPALFHAGCTALPCKDFPYKASPFSYWMQHLASRKDFPYRASPFSYLI